MAYPHQYAGPPGYVPSGGFTTTGPPGFPAGGPPGFPTPTAPGFPQHSQNMPTSASHIQPNFPSHIDPHAQVIHFTNQPFASQQHESNAPKPRDGGHKRGLGYQHGTDGGHKQHRDNELLKEPTQNEVARTIGIEVPAGFDDAKMDMVLCSVGGLRRWIPVTSVDGKPTGYGLAEFTDAEGLAVATAVLTDVMVPIKESDRIEEEVKDEATVKKEDDAVKQDDAEADAGAENDVSTEKPVNAGVHDSVKIPVKEEAKGIPLKVDVSEASREYTEKWTSHIDQSTLDARIAAAKQAVVQTLYNLVNGITQYPGGPDANGYTTSMQAIFDPLTGEAITIPLEKEDEELDNVPDEQRAHVAAEIAAFRDRSLRRDIERQKREEETQKRDFKPRPTGPTHGTNGIPTGPRGAAPPNAPRSMQATDARLNHAAGRQSSISAAPSRAKWMKEVGDDVVDDEELERRRLKRKNEREDAEFQKALTLYNKKQEARKADRMRVRTANSEKEGLLEKRQAQMLDQMKRHTTSLSDRARRRDAWHTNKQDPRLIYDRAVLEEEDEDRADREAEEADNRAAAARAASLADALTAQQAAAPQAPKIGNFKLGTKAQPTGQLKRSALAMEAQAQDEAEAAMTKRHPPKRIQVDPEDEDAFLTTGKHADVRKRILQSIGRDRQDLFKTPVDWRNISEAAINGPIKNRVTYVLNQKEPDGSALFLVSHILKRIKEHRDAEVLQPLLVEGFDRYDAEDILIEIWRYVLAVAEITRRGLYEG